MDLRSVDLNLLVTLEAVIAERSVTRAALALGLTQSAVSHALGRLRRTFRDDLLVRGPEGMVPTPRGRELAAVLGRSFSEIERVLESERHFDPATSDRRFTVCASDYVAPFLLTELCARLRREAPAVALDVRHFRDPDERVEQHELHLRVGGPGGAGDPAAENVALLADDYVVLMSRDHPHADAELTLDRYLDLNHIKVSPHALGTNVIDDALAGRGLRRHVAITVPSWFEMRNVVAATDLVVAMPRRWAGAPSFAAGCVWRPLPLPEVTFAVDVCWRRRDRHEPGLRWLRELVLGTFADAPNAIPGAARPASPPRASP